MASPPPERRSVVGSVMRDLRRASTGVSDGESTTVDDESMPGGRTARKLHAQVTAAALLTSPPDGVCLLSLANAESAARPEQVARMYEQALEHYGGRSVLAEYSDRSRELSRSVVRQGILPRQPAVWQAYTVDQMIGVASWGPLRKFGEQKLASLAERLQEKVSPRLKLNLAAPKRQERAWVKAKIKYGLDCSRLCDLNRATLQCPCLKTMYGALEEICRCWGPEAGLATIKILEIDDHYQSPFPEGYCHVQLLVLMSGAVWELQLNTEAMLEAKDGSGHELYKTTRFVREMLLLCSMSDELDACKEMLQLPGVRGVADPDGVVDKNGLRALHHAAFRGTEGMLSLLLQLGPGPPLVSNPADPWSVDGADLGGLPLNYALRMRHWGAAEILVSAMRARPPAGQLPAKVVRRLLEAASVAIDAWDERPALVPAICSLCRQHAPESCSGENGPVSYAFQCKAESALRGMLLGDGGEGGPVFGESLWTPDELEKLPVERAVAYGMLPLAEDLAEVMLRTKPAVVASGAAWSLLRCQRRESVSESAGRLSQLLRSNDQRIGRRLWTASEDAPRRIEVRDPLRQDKLSVYEQESYVYSFLQFNGIVYAGTGSGSIYRFELKPDGKDVQLRSLKGHTQLVRGMVLSPGPQRRLLFSISYDKQLIGWDPATGEQRMVVKLPRRLRCCIASHQHLYVSGHNELRQFDTITFKTLGILRGHNARIADLGVLEDKHRVISICYDGDLRVWNPDTRECVQKFCVMKPRVPASIALRCFVRIGEMLYVACEDGHIRVWDLERWTEVFEWRARAVVTHLVAEDGVIYAADIDGHIRLWGTDGELYGDWHAHPSGVKAMIMIVGDRGQGRSGAAGAASAKARPSIAASDAASESAASAKARPSIAASDAASEPAAASRPAASEPRQSVASEVSETQSVESSDRRSVGEKEAAAAPRRQSSAAGSRGSGGRSPADPPPRAPAQPPGRRRPSSPPADRTRK
eukprot:TRINITY_DN1047_c0_g1_i3.p1 TRINITY_DN1047_c0_g1~~TRINITY_DN1047_c0_g1_i3.p1  ORF type:complete len:1016 (+),score=264.78 TRINITY_DN1047_c0_g1_i3:94-3048(+)